MVSNLIKVPDPLEFFPGEWQFVRRITDHLTLQTGEARGKAVFSGSGGGLAWTEHGKLRMNGYNFGASRTLRILPEGESWMVCFDDGRPFHPLDLSDGRCEAGHPCRNDFYTGDFKTEGSGFSTDWRVCGPHKDQRIISTYTRA